MTDGKAADLSSEQRRELLKQILRERAGAAPQTAPRALAAKVPEAFYRFDQDPAILGLMGQQAELVQLGLANPFFQVNEGVARGTTTIGGQTLVNYANYNYLGLCGEAAVSRAAQEAITKYGTSVSASRIASGDRPVQRELEAAIADFMNTEDCVVFVSGHATNVTTIGHLFGPKDMILHDELAHNSAIQGALLSEAKRLPFPHNDHLAVDRLLTEYRGMHERVLIFLEGVYSMDGDFPDLPRFVELKNKHKTYLMVDEAHSIGVLGKGGLGIREHFGLAGAAVDLWMGTLSKTMASCGGYIAGSKPLVEYLKYTAPGFLYSVGITPANAAAALAAIGIMQTEPERVATLRKRADLFLELAREKGLDTGLCGGTAVVPVIIGDSLKCIALANALFERGINVQPVLYPAVEEDAARLRFFITSAHTEAQIRETVAVVVEELERLGA